MAASKFQTGEGSIGIGPTQTFDNVGGMWIPNTGYTGYEVKPSLQSPTNVPVPKIVGIKEPEGVDIREPKGNTLKTVKIARGRRFR